MLKDEKVVKWKEFEEGSNQVIGLGKDEYAKYLHMLELEHKREEYIIYGRYDIICGNILINMNSCAYFSSKIEYNFTVILKVYMSMKSK